ncbi:hypothetical protein, partial [Pseudomonas sp. 79_C]|uniref:hypothetical protein n=1 Tax=Pseudomonas sp. 79_C TaxID=2813567 RepID=UPI001A9D372B
MNVLRDRISIWPTLLLVAAMFAFGISSASAQEAAHPVHIHSGTCDALGEVVHPLTDVTTYNVTNSFSFGPAATPVAATDATPMAAVSVSEETP